MFDAGRIRIGYMLGLASMLVNVVKASEALTAEIPSREVKKAYQIAWLNTVCHIEDEASSELDKKVEWYSDHHDNLTNDVRMAENKASAE